MKETLEEAAERILLVEDLDLSDYDKRHILNAMLNIAKWQQEQMYSEEELRKAMNWTLTQYFEFHECPTTGRMDHYVQSIKQQEQ